MAPSKKTNSRRRPKGTNKPAQQKNTQQKNATQQESDESQTQKTQETRPRENEGRLERARRRRNNEPNGPDDHPPTQISNPGSTGPISEPDDTPDHRSPAPEGSPRPAVNRNHRRIESPEPAQQNTPPRSGGFEDDMYQDWELGSPASQNDGDQRIQAAEEEAARYKRAAKQLQRDVQALRRQIVDGRTGQAPGQLDKDAPGPVAAGDKRTATPEPADSDDQRTYKKQKIAVKLPPLDDAVWDNILHLGKEFCVAYMLWLPAKAVWQHVSNNIVLDKDEDPLELAENPANQDNDNEPTEEQQDRVKFYNRVKEAACLLRDMIPDHLLKLFTRRDARTRFEQGMGAIRAWAVKNIADKHADIFGILDPQFKHKAKRRELPAVKALLENDSFLYKPGERTIIDGYLRHQCIGKASSHFSLKLLFWGSSSLSEIKTKTRGTNGKIWSLTETTDGLLAFITTCIYFVLTGDPIFSDNADGTDFAMFYEERLKKLEAYAEKTEHKYEKLMKYYDNMIFHSKTDNQTTARNEMEKRFDEELAAAEDDPPSEEDT
ncbi:hypothetical protein EIP86_007485 [Pleurotus ostreatoroseus]|nr:hypothetical protein EIP86_007485 [Pleurotus ostreatoroseus]